VEALPIQAYIRLPRLQGGEANEGERQRCGTSEEIGLLVWLQHLEQIKEEKQDLWKTSQERIAVIDSRAGEGIWTAQVKTWEETEHWINRLPCPTVGYHISGEVPLKPTVIINTINIEALSVVLDDNKMS